jgi:hypothetical protein
MLHFMAPAVRRVPDNITEHCLGNQSVGTMTTGFVYLLVAGENYVGSLNQLVHTTVIAANSLIRY